MNRRGLKGILTTGVLATSLLASTSAMAQNSGSTTLELSKGAEIEVLSWSWGESNGSVETRRGTLPKICIQDLNLMKLADANSAQLLTKSTLGEVIADATLRTKIKAGLGPNDFDYVYLRMSNVIVTAFQVSWGGERPTESVSLHFDSGRYEYLPFGSTNPIIAEIGVGNSPGCR